jgi:hypothetical protein
MSKRTEGGDAENTAFGFPQHVAEHKPGLDHGDPKREVETDDNHRFRRSQKKDIPQESRAVRIGKARKRK